MEFYEWTKEKGNIEKGVRLYKSELYANFLQDYPDYANGKYKLSQKRFKQYLSFCFPSIASAQHDKANSIIA